NLSVTNKVPNITNEDMENEILKLQKELSKSNSREIPKETVKLENTSSSGSAWKMYDPNEWKHCPMGCLSDGQIPCLDLPLDLDGPSTFFSDSRREANMMQIE
ncbi:5986_t:CDS:2, partial [Acaulospora morrowiae]